MSNHSAGHLEDSCEEPSPPLFAGNSVQIQESRNDDSNDTEASPPLSPAPSTSSLSGLQAGATSTEFVPKSRIYVMVAGEAGLIFSWVLRFALTTPYFQHTLNSGTVISHAVWILGPVSGLVVAPLVGVLSDRCTSPFGRRRPFIFWGLIASLISMNVFASAKQITAFIGLKNEWAPIFLAVSSYAVIDLAANTIMFPSRALLGDIVPKEQQHDVQSSAAVIASLTEIIGSLYIYSLDEPVTRIRDAYVVATIVMVISVSVTLYICKEKPNAGPTLPRESESSQLEHREWEMESWKSEGDQGKPLYNEEDDDDEMGATGDAEQVQHPEEATGDPLESQNTGVLLSAYELLRTAVMSFPKELNQIAAVYALAWFCWYSSLPYFSAWIGSEVLGGEPDAPIGSAEAAAYQRGVNIFAIANVFKAVLALSFSATYPTMLKIIGVIGERLIFAGTFALFSPVLFLLSDTKNAFLSGLTVALSSFAFVATQTIPIAIVVQRYSQNVASNLGILNLFCVLPQLIDTLYTGWLAKTAGEAAVLKIAAAWGTASAVAAYFLL